MRRTELFSDPDSLFQDRIDALWERIQTLNNDYRNVNHYFSKAIIENERDKAVDDFIERSFVLQATNKEESD